MLLGSIERVAVANVGALAITRQAERGDGQGAFACVHGAQCRQVATQLCHGVLDTTNRDLGNAIAGLHGDHARGALRGRCTGQTRFIHKVVVIARIDGHPGRVVCTLDVEADGAAAGVAVLVGQAVAQRHGNRVSGIQRLGRRFAVVQREAPAAVCVAHQRTVVAQIDCSATVEHGVDAAPGHGIRIEHGLAVRTKAVARGRLDVTVHHGGCTVFCHPARIDGCRHRHIVHDGDRDVANCSTASIPADSDFDCIFQSIVVRSRCMRLCRVQRVFVADRARLVVGTRGVSRDSKSSFTRIHGW